MIEPKIDFNIKSKAPNVDPVDGLRAYVISKHHCVCLYCQYCIPTHWKWFSQERERLIVHDTQGENFSRYHLTILLIILQDPLKLEINEINMLLMRCDLFLAEFNRFTVTCCMLLALRNA